MKRLAERNSKRIRACRRRGSLSPLGMLLVTVLMSIGALVGSAALRDQIAQELGDLAVALDQVNQSFSVNITLLLPDPEPCLVTSYEDPGPPLTDPVGEEPACLQISSDFLVEGQELLPPPGTLP